MSISGIPFERRPLASAENTLKITCAIYDKKTNQWVPTQLNEEEKTEIETRVRQLEKFGEKIHFNPSKLGEEYKITKQGIFHNEGGREVNLVNAKELAGKERKNLKSRIHTVASQLSKIAHADAKNVRIEIKVVERSSEQFLDAEYKKEYAFYEVLTRMEEMLSDPNRERTLKEAGYTQNEIDTLMQQLSSLKETSAGVLRLMWETLTLLSQGDRSQAAKTYNDQIEELFFNYTSALQTLSTSQKVMEGRLGKQSFLRLPLDQPHHHYTIIKELNARLAPEVDHSERMSQFSSRLQDYDQELAPSESSQRFKGFADNEKRAIGDLRGFLEDVKRDRKTFYDCLRAEGISDLEGHFIINSLQEMLSGWEEIEKEIKHAEDLFNQGNEEAAVKLLGQIREQRKEAFKKNQDVLSELIPFLTAEVKKKLTGGVAFSNGLKRFYAATQQKQPSTLQDINQYLGVAVTRLNHYQLFEQEKTPGEFEKLGQVPSLEIMSRGPYEDLRATLLDRNHRNNTLFAGLQENAHRSTWLNESGWTLGEVKEFSRINQEYAQEIEPLYRGFLAVDKASSLIEKRNLLTQLKKRAVETIPRLNKITARLSRLANPEKMRRLQNVLQMRRDSLRAHLGDELKQKNASFEELNAFVTTDEGRRNFREIFSENDVTLYRDLQALDKDLASLQAFEFKTEFLNDFYDDCVHMRMSLRHPRAEAIFSRSRFTSDPAWAAELRKVGLSLQEVGQFVELYNDFEKAMEPVYLAAAELADDPENLQSQKELKEVAQVHKGTLSAVNKKMQRWGGVERLQRLTRAMESYKKELETVIKNSPSSREAENAQLYLEELNQSPDFAVVALNRNQQMKDIYDTLSLTLTGEKHYVSTHLKASNAKFQKQWNDLIKNMGLKQKDLEQLDHIYDQLNREITTLQKLERQSAAEPENKEIQAKFRKKALEKENQLAHIQFEFEAWGGESKLNQVQQAIHNYKTILQQELIRNQNEAIKLGPLETISNKELDRADLLYQEKQRLQKEIKRIDSLNVQLPLQHRFGFVNRVYGELGVHQSLRA